MLVEAAGKISPIIITAYKQFGDPVQHPLHMKSHMLKCLQQIKVHPDNLQSYLTMVQKYHCSTPTFPGCTSPLLTSHAAFPQVFFHFLVS
jgi:hypothetical protein